MTEKKVAVIGAGLSGLVVAKNLPHSYEVDIFDKSRGVGGRMSTRRTDDFHFDHGAQYFVAKSPEFKSFCKAGIEEGVISVWDANVAYISGHKIEQITDINENEPHYVGNPQMNSLCKWLAKDLTIHTSKQVTSIEKSSKWALNTSEERFEGYDYVIFAIPSHQASALLPDNFSDKSEVEAAKMQGCFTMMIGLADDIKMPFDAAFVTDSILDWVSRNNSKPGRKGSTIVVNSANAWADENIEHDIKDIEKQMMKELTSIISLEESDISYQTIHRWRYANAPSRGGQERSFFDPSLGIGVCGDWLLKGRVESAFLSGLDITRKLASHLKSDV